LSVSLPSIDLILRNLNGSWQQRVKSNAGGAFAFENIPPGSYSLIMDPAGGWGLSGSPISADVYSNQTTDLSTISVGSVYPYVTSFAVLPGKVLQITGGNISISPSPTLAYADSITLYSYNMAEWTSASMAVSVSMLKPGSYTLKLVNPDASNSVASGQVFIGMSLPQITATSSTVNSVTVNWQAVDFAENYEVNLNGGVWQSESTTSRTYMSLTSSTSYTIGIRAVGYGVTGPATYVPSKTLRASFLAPASFTTSISVITGSGFRDSVVYNNELFVHANNQLYKVSLTDGSQQAGPVDSTIADFDVGQSCVYVATMSGGAGTLCAMQKDGSFSIVGLASVPVTYPYLNDVRVLYHQPTDRLWVYTNDPSMFFFENISIWQPDVSTYTASYSFPLYSSNDSFGWTFNRDGSKLLMAYRRSGANVPQYAIYNTINMSFVASGSFGSSNQQWMDIAPIGLQNFSLINYDWTQSKRYFIKFLTDQGSLITETWPNVSFYESAMDSQERIWGIATDTNINDSITRYNSVGTVEDRKDFSLILPTYQNFGASRMIHYDPTTGQIIVLCSDDTSSRNMIVQIFDASQ